MHLEYGGCLVCTDEPQYYIGLHSETLQISEYLQSSLTQARVTLLGAVFVTLYRVRFSLINFRANVALLKWFR